MARSFLIARYYEITAKMDHDTDNLLLALQRVRITSTFPSHTTLQPPAI